jgi:nucleotide-binding universal stress UspA family protein
MKVLLAVDGSEFTHRMLGYVAAHDELFSSETRFTVLTVAPRVPSGVEFLDPRSLESFYLDEAERVLKPVRSFIAQQGWKVEFVEQVGRAGDRIAELATSRKFDLIVMGSHGHSALGNVVLGSVANRVLAKCKTPVLLIR